MKFWLERYPSNENPRPILEPRPEVEWEGRAVFNPSVVYDSGIFHMVYRTYPSTLKESTPRLNRAGYYFENNISCVGYAQSTDGINFERRNLPFISPDTDYDCFSCEDPRMTKIGDTYYITYTAIDAPIYNRDVKPKVRIALASTKDFKSVTKHGIVGPPEKSKAAAILPDLVDDGKIGLMLTVSPDTGLSHISIRYYDNIEQLIGASSESWGEYFTKEQIVMKTQPWLYRGPELGAVPVKTKLGWLIIFSSEAMSASWTIGAALLDAESPHKLIARAPGCILQPVATYEREGLVPNVTFPEGAVVAGDNLYVYYGCADTVIGLATCKLNDLLDYITKYEAH